jgi:hypothetical protein
MLSTSFGEISLDDLAHVTGGVQAVARASPNPFGFLDELYKGLVFNIAGNIGGAQLATKMYGAKTTAADLQRSKAAFQQFLKTGNKLPRGVPRFGGR